MYDFTPFTTLSSWKDYAGGLGGVKFAFSNISGDKIWQENGPGFIEFGLPSWTDTLSVSWGSPYDANSAAPGGFITVSHSGRVQSVNNGQVNVVYFLASFGNDWTLRITEEASVLDRRIIVTLRPACAIGYTQANDGSCTSCPVNTYKNTTGSASCSLCLSLSPTVSLTSQLTQEPIVTPSVLANSSGATHKSISFEYAYNSSLVFDFSSKKDIASWTSYATQIGATFDLNSYGTCLNIGSNNWVPGVCYYWHNGYGFFRLPLPSGFDTVTVTFGNGGAANGVGLYIGIPDANGNIQSARGVAGNSMVEHSQYYAPGSVLKLDETFGMILIGQIILSNGPEKTYTIDFPQATDVTINNGASQILQGLYAVTVGPVQSNVKKLYATGVGPLVADPFTRTFATSTATSYRDGVGTLVYDANRAMLVYKIVIRYSMTPTIIVTPATSASASTASTNCRCIAGYTGLDGGACSACGAGKYKTATGSANCTDCNAGKYSNDTGASSIGTCANCGAGTFSAAVGAASSATCAACAAGTGALAGASSSGTCGACGAGKFSTAGSGCIDCRAGKYSPTTGAADESACLNCPPNSYGNTTAAVSASACRACPSNSLSTAGSTRIDDCLCNAGFRQSEAHDACTLCSPGYYDESSTRYECSRCGAGLYSAAEGAPDVESCRPCPPGTWSESGSPDCHACFENSDSPEASGSRVNCTCIAGAHGPDGAACQLCAAGSYKAARGSAACSLCGAGKHSAAPGAASSGTCQDCGAGSFSAAAASVCISCAAGTFSAASASVCSSCGAGKYSTTVGASSATTCLNCDANKYSATTGASSSTTCLVCDANSVSLAGSPGSDYCHCAAGTSAPLSASYHTHLQCMWSIFTSYNTETWINSNGMFLLHDGGNQWTIWDNVLVLRARTTTGPSNGYQIDLHKLTGWTLGLWCGSGPQFYWTITQSVTSCTACVPGTYSRRGQNSCTSCAANTYSSVAGASSSATCLHCPANTQSVSGSAACQCNAGYTPNGGSCAACAAGTFKPTAGSAACAACAAGKFSAAVGASSDATCRPCGADTYSTVAGATSCEECPWSSQSPVGSNRSTQCQCNAGFEGADGEECSGCRASTYKASVGSAACSSCPGNSTSLLESTSLSSCQCSAAFTGPDGGPCSACAAGRYKNVVGSRACLLIPITSCLFCEVGTYSDVAGASACKACEVGPGLGFRPVLPAGAVGCFCPAGAHWASAASNCSACAAGTFSTGAAFSCPHCSAGTYSLPSASVCQNCSAGQYSTAERASAASTCINCGAGKYSTTSGASVASTCTDCGAGTYSTVAGATTPSSCEECPSSSQSPVGSNRSTQCQCNAGFTGADGKACSACAAGSYKATAGSLACTFCGEDLYSTSVAAVSAAACAACPQHSYSVAGSGAIDQCHCTPGYKQTPSHDACMQCDPGYFDSAINRFECSKCAGGLYSAAVGATGNETCKPCSAGGWSAEGSPTCEVCPANSNSPAESAVLTACTCNAGATGLDGQTCVLCMAGKYKAAVGSAACTDCPADSLSPIASNLSTQCQCNAGFTGADGDACSACAAGKYKDTVGSVGCTECAAGKHRTTTGASAASSCTDCEAGKYSTALGASVASTCIDCGAGTYSTVSGSTELCKSCPANSVSPPGSSLLTNCLCNLGYAGPHGGTCTACTAGKYNSLAGATLCVECVAGKYSTAVGAPDTIACRDCGAGKYQATAGSVHCDECEAGKHKPVAGTNTACDVCQAGKYKATAGVNTACDNCGAGKYLTATGASSESSCVTCAANTYSGTLGATADSTCVACLTNSQSASGSPDSTSCLCNGGYTGPNGGSCTACAAGTYNVVPGATLCVECGAGKYSTTTGAAVESTCTACLVNSQSPSASTICVCMAGYTGLDGGQCLACVVSKYKATTGSASCTDCATNSGHAWTAQTAATPCVCNLGFTGPDGEACVACAAGKYKAGFGSAPCTDCGAGKYSKASPSSLAAAASAESTCVDCGAGTYVATTGASGCIACPQYSTSASGSTSIQRCECVPGTFLEPVLAAQYTQLSDDNFNAGDDGGLAALDVSRGLAVTVRWETLAFEVRNALGVVVFSPESFEGTTELFVQEDFVEPLFYGCSGSEACGAQGEITLQHARFECVAKTNADALHRVFVSKGRLDDNRSCAAQCQPGFFRTHNLRGARCQPHWNPVCGAGEFRVAGTPENNAYCRSCSGCAGKRLVRRCHATADDDCADCGAGAGPPGAGRIWTNAHGEPCLAGCEFGRVLNQRTQVCETCTQRCPGGYSFPAPAARHNCTHCVACESLGVQLPKGAVWDTMEDLEAAGITCVAACPVGSAFQALRAAASPAGALECVEMLPVERRSMLQTPAPASARCGAPGSDDAETCALPGCRLHQGACTSCFELPADVRRGLNEEARELLPGRGLLSPEDAMKLRWQFTAACEWTCLSPWVPLQSEDRTYWKCETREFVESILDGRTRWTAANNQNLEWVKTQVSAEPDGAAQSERLLRMLVVLACVGAPVVMLLCVLCLNITRACFRAGPEAKA